MAHVLRNEKIFRDVFALSLDIVTNPSVRDILDIKSSFEFIVGDVIS